MEKVVAVLWVLMLVTGYVTAPADEPENPEGSESEIAFELWVQNILLQAVKLGDSDSAKAAIDLGADVNEEISEGYSMLMDASYMGRMELVRVLLDAGARVNDVSATGVTALLAACQEGHRDIIRLLLDAGADVRVSSSKDGSTPLMFTISRQIPDISQHMIEQGADVNAHNAVGQTALMFASQYGQIETARQLLDAGADINAATVEGATALMYAVQFDQTDIARLLVDSGADVNMRLHNGETAITIATYLGHRDIVEILTATQDDTGSHERRDRDRRERATLSEQGFLVELSALVPFVHTPLGVGWGLRVILYAGTASTWAIGAGGFTGVYSIPNAGLHPVHGLCAKAIRFTDGPLAYSFGAGVPFSMFGVGGLLEAGVNLNRLSLSLTTGLIRTPHYVEDPVDPAEACPNWSWGNPANYPCNTRFMLAIGIGVLL